MGSLDIPAAGAVAALPLTPGVYRFRDPAGRVLYIGRAVSLRRRVRSYWRDLGDRAHLAPMVARIARVEAVPCDSAHEAAWLERNLLERRLPPWNRSPGGQEAEVWIRLSASPRAPGLTVVRQPAPGDFGPYLGGQKVRDAVSGLNRVLPLGHAADHQAGTGRELALVRGVSPGARDGLARGVAAVLDRDQAAVAALRAELTVRRAAAATALAFEFAGKLQAELEAVDWITAEQKVTRDQRDPRDADVYGWAGGVLVCFEIRGGRMSGWRQRSCTAAAARRHLEQSSPDWTAFAQRSAELAANLSLTSPSARALPCLYDPRMTGPAEDAAVQVAGLRMSFGSTEVLHGVDFDVRYGEVFCLLGPNGAGKTTTLEILEGFRAPSAGRVRVLGINPAAQPVRLRERVGMVLQECGFPRQARVAELIGLWRTYYPDPRPLGELLEVVELTEVRNTQVRKLSGGQRRRLDFALALAGDPDLIFLDEPTTGFDPEARRRCWAALENLRALGKTILLTTHYLDEAERLADRIAILRAGRIELAGTIQQVAARVGLATRISFTTPAALRRGQVPLPDGIDLACSGPASVCHTGNAAGTLRLLLAWAAEHGLGDLDGLAVTAPRLEEAYLSLTQDPP